MDVPKKILGAQRKRRGEAIDDGSRKGREGRFVGHWVFFFVDGEIKYGLGDDWSAALLSPKAAWNFLKESALADESFMDSIDEANTRFGGPVVFHFYVKDVPGEGRLIRLFDCAPGCEAGQPMKDLLRR